MSDSDSLDYLKTGFDPASLTVPRLRSILVSHDVEYPSGAKKPQLIQIFVDKVVPQSRKILAARARARRTSKGITDADSQESTTSTTETTDITGGDEDVMPPPPTPRTRTRKPSAKIRADESESDLPVSRSPTKRASRASSKRPRASDTETDHYPDSVQRSVRKTRRSEDPTPVPVSAVREPRIKLEDVDNTEDSSRRESAFTYDNPFQSGSSPLSSSRSPSGERRRKSHGVTASTRKSTSTTRRRTDVPKVDDGFHPPTSATFEIPVSDLADLKDYDENGVEAFEEFTPEEQLELVRERSAKGLDALGPRRPKKQSPGFNKSKPIWLAFLTLLGGYAMWYRQEKIAVGYCGVGREAHEIFPTEVEVPDWIRILVEPECEPCPPHAYCYQKLQTECEADFVLRPHPLSLGSLVPLPPTCEPDGEKIGRIMKVADRAVKVLRARKADWECGGLTDETGAPDTTLEIDEEALKKQVIHNKGKKIGISASEFEELWAGAIGEVQGREEVISIEDGFLIPPTETEFSSQAPPPSSSPTSASSDDPSEEQWQDIASRLLLTKCRNPASRLIDPRSIS
ncbi:hypothetical protein G7Y89_g15770 [Cudoniella acicularis]|uniref:LEM-like domain-containing protein n=1 Tax=Cudoniella acicularis TaxID=354080 RepID=A0A8H4QGK4_9HELO|nr:hypothetical protein G7Y89_g15770 [Cudoniella acicularis]